VFNVKLGLGKIQKKLEETNSVLARFGGLYKWWTLEASTQYMLLMFGVAAMFLFVPFRFIFTMYVLNFFTDKWQAQNPAGSYFHRLIARVQVPEHAKPGDTTDKSELLPYCPQCQAYLTHPSFLVPEGESAGVKGGASEVATIAGWVQKKRRLLPGWRARWYVVASGHAVYFEHEENVGVSPPQGVIHMGAALLEDPEPEGLSLEIAEHDKPRLVIKLASAPLKQQWLRALLLACRFGTADSQVLAGSHSEAHASQSLPPKVDADTLRRRSSAR
jgi:hypothetical protein